jgi:hypothetical protein
MINRKMANNIVNISMEAAKGCKTRGSRGWCPLDRNAMVDFCKLFPLSSSTLFIYYVLNAAYKDEDNLKKGECIKNYSVFKSAWDKDPKQVNEMNDELVKLGCISVSRLNENRIKVTVNKYDDFFSCNCPSGPQNIINIVFNGKVKQLAVEDIVK